jgi:hypothetical protein
VESRANRQVPPASLPLRLLWHSTKSLLKRDSVLKVTSPATGNAPSSPLPLRQEKIFEETEQAEFYQKSSQEHSLLYLHLIKSYPN